MSFLRDVLSFERFSLRDMGKSLRKDPERLFLGAVDPFSTRMWNKTGIGKDWEPITDQFGGPYSGTAMGGGNEGIYGRAAARGIPTGPGGDMHAGARAIASIYAGNYGMGKLPTFGSGGGMANSPQWLQKLMAGRPPMGGMAPGGTPLGGTGGWAGGGTYPPPWSTPPLVPPQAAPAGGGQLSGGRNWGPPPPARFAGPPWLQRIAGGLNKATSMGAPQASPYLTQQENDAANQRQKVAMMAQLLQASAPRPRGSGSAMADFGGAVMAGQQASDQFTSDAIRAKLMQAQIAQSQQGGQDPSDIRTMQALGYPLTPEGFKDFNAAQARPGTTITIGEKLNEPIPIAQLDTVRLPDGTTPPIGTTYAEARNMGAKVLSAEDQRRTQQADQAMGILNQLEELAVGPDGVFKEVAPGLANRVASAIDFGFDMLDQKDPRASQFADMSKATLAPFIKFLGETGSLAQGDVERALGLVPRIFPLPDTGEVAKEKLDALREIITRGVRNMNSVTRQSPVPAPPDGYTLDPE